MVQMPWLHRVSPNKGKSEPAMVQMPRLHRVSPNKGKSEPAMVQMPDCIVSLLTKGKSEPAMVQMPWLHRVSHNKGMSEPAVCPAGNICSVPLLHLCSDPPPHNFLIQLRTQVWLTLSLNDGDFTVGAMVVIADMWSMLDVLSCSSFDITVALSVLIPSPSSTASVSYR